MRDSHRYFTMSSGPAGGVDPDDIEECLDEACTNGFSVNGVGVYGVGTNGLLCGSVKTAACVHVFDGDGDGDVDDDDEALIDSASNDMYRRHPLLISESHFGNPFMWTGQRYDAEAKLYHFRYRSYNPALGRRLRCDLFAVRGKSHHGGGARYLARTENRHACSVRSC
jgi:RHS repeat-associated protein